MSAGSEQSRYPRKEKLDQKISLYTGDITKLEIDAIVNAGMCVCVNEFVVFSLFGLSSNMVTNGQLPSSMFKSDANNVTLIS